MKTIFFCFWERVLCAKGRELQGLLTAEVKTAKTFYKKL